MREIQKSSIIGFAALTLVGLLLGGFLWWNREFNTPFRDLTLELGSPVPAVSDFLKAGAVAENAHFVTDIQPLVGRLGTHTVTLRSRTARQSVKLTVVDTTAPEVVFRDIFADRETPLKPEQFVLEARDLSPITVKFLEEPAGDTSAEETKVTVVVTDSCGNATQGACTVTYSWMHPALTLELGQQVTKEMILLNPARDAALLEQSQLDKINESPVGTYTVTAGEGVCEVTVADTTAPVLELKAVKMDSNQKLSIDQFVKKVSDASGDVKLSYEKTPDHTKEGDHKVVIIATDPNGNTTQAETTLKVSYDTTAPSFSGVSAMTVKRGATPNYTKGVKAKDSRDGEVKFTVDTSRVNTDKTGTYYAIYTATDSSGNTATYRRKITVGHGPEDTKELVRSVAAKLGNDPVAICKWVANNISYGNSKTSDWGGDDPVWQGLKNKRGNCYVHAMVLDALLKEKGFDTQLIHVTEIKYFSNAKANKPSHYWNLVKVDGVWRHIDSTPGTKHPKYLMNDNQRHANLQGRDWDRTKWPKCE